MDHNVIETKHPVYLIDLGEGDTKWLTREKLRRCERNATPYELQEDPQTEEAPEEAMSTDSSEESEEEDDNEVAEDNLFGRGNRLRRNVHIPDRFGNVVAHFAKIIYT